MSESIIQAADYVYAHTIGITPGLKDTPMFSAFGVSFACAYGITKGVQWGAKKISPNFYNNYLPIIEKQLSRAVIAVPLIYSIVDPEGAKGFVMNHPVCLAGFVGGFSGGIRAAMAHVNDKEKNYRLENVIDATLKKYVK